ncbi:hypothetical protein [Streptomyces sp. Wb2n-11]|uniref:hypothetical protein n=1 Tax=Streptomyces sp. Wb2n-11 TaxID=1030533 RepID=UPI000A939FF7|nr:hypothetical protein [Streptomyces sp. Wb2n-11]
MVFAPDPVELSSFAAEHERLSTSPESGFVRVLQAQLRDAKGVDMLRGCVLRRIDAEGTYERTIDSADNWYGVLADVFHLNLTDVAAPRGQRCGTASTPHTRSGRLRGSVQQRSDGTIG